ncbi:tetratricopeptide repeat protein [Geoalkalibacter halelectricus]|uniref:tetratricopeptide repeat protein n=1 Tax=Geoalkalibacter halelectricus TaxID=2847045 RepID=UPI003D24CA5A
MLSPRTDPVAEFKRLVDSLPEGGRGGGVELLLARMEPRKANQLRLCAIPHHFDADLLRLLAPELDADLARERCEEFMRLAIVIASGEDLILHEEARTYLFHWWLRPENWPDFVAANAALVDWFSHREGEPPEAQREEWQDQRMFHLLGCDQEQGFAEFERLFGAARHDFRLSRCAALLRLVEEYRAVLDPEQGLWLDYQTGKLSLDRNDLGQAQGFFDAILAAAQTPTLLRIKTHSRLGQLAAARQNYSLAITHYRQAMELAADAGLDYPTHRILHDLAAAHRDNDEPRQAEQILNQAIEGATRAGSLLDLAACYNSLGTLHLRHGDLEPAVSAYRQCLDHLEQGGYRFRMAQALNNLGMALVRQGALGEGEQHLSQSLGIKRQAGDSLGVARTLNNLVEVYRRQGKSDLALGACVEALGLFDEMRAGFEAATAYLNLSQLYRDRQAQDLSRQACEEAIKRFRACGAQDQVETAQTLLTSFEARRGLPWWGWLVLVLGLGLIALVAVELLVKEDEEGLGQALLSAQPPPGEVLAELALGVWVEAGFDGGEEPLWWRIVIEQPGTYVISAIGVDTFDPILVLRLEDGEIIWVDDSDADQNARLRVFLPAGEHLLAVAEYTGRPGQVLLSIIPLEP